MATSLHNEDLVAMMCEMIKARKASDRLSSLQPRDRVATIHPIAPIDGQEATTVGATWALDPAHDWVLPQCHEPMALGRYGPEPLNRFAAWTLGHPLGGHLPEPVKVFPPQIAPAAQLLHAVGLAWALKLRNEAAVALAFLGDGSSSEGDFYEAVNLAGVLEVPVIMVCSNNQSPLSTPLGRQAALPGQAAKAEAFGIHGATVDGMDPLAVHEVVSAARARAVAGHGATLIEALHHRLNADDPLVTFRRQLEDRGLWDRAMQTDAERTGEAAIDAAWSWAMHLPLQQTDLLDHVFATPTPRQLRQRAALEALLRSGR